MTGTLPNTAQTLQVQQHFPPRSAQDQQAAWLALLERELKGAAPESLDKPLRGGLPRKALYTAADALPPAALGQPGTPPFVRGNRPFGTVEGGWELRQQIALADPAQARAALEDDLANGVDGLSLKLDGGAWLPDGADGNVAGHAPAGEGGTGIVLGCLADLSALLADVNPQRTALHPSAGGLFLPGAALLAAWWRAQAASVAAPPPKGSLQADPLGALISGGALPVSVDAALAQAAALAQWCDAHLPGVPALRVSTAPSHDAGASAAQELGVALATGVAYLRALEAAGLQPERAARQIAFDVALGADLFPAVAGLRALRRCWARVLQACGVPSAACHMPLLQAHLGWRELTARDPHGNLLRGTAAVVAGVLGGAEAITLRPFDAAQAGGAGGTAFSRKLARNTQHLLREESQLHRVADPLGGSWYGEALTAELAQAGWGAFQQIEQGGGLVAVLQNGWLAERIATARAAGEEAVATRRQSLVGVSEFADPEETLPAPDASDRAALRRQARERAEAAADGQSGTPASVALSALRDAAAQPPSADLVEAMVTVLGSGASMAQVTALLLRGAEPARVPALRPQRWAEPWEALRAACDAAAAAGKRPRACLLGIGPEARHGARSAFARDLLQAAGVEVASVQVAAEDGAGCLEAALTAFATADAGLAVLCGDDADYAEPAGRVPALAAGLKRAGAQQVLLVGRGGAQQQAWHEAGVDAFIYRGADLLAAMRQALATQGVTP